MKRRNRTKTKKTEEKKETGEKGKEPTKDEIDEIFTKTKEKVKTEEKKEKPEKRTKRTATVKAAAGSSELDKRMDPKSATVTRKKVDGFAVYSLEELGLNPNSGGTPLCPFDCDCCH